jgi:phosphoribosylanthranilate isomerase
LCQSIRLHSDCSTQEIRELRGLFDIGSCNRNIKLIRSLHANGQETHELFESMHRLQNDVDALIIDTIDKQGDKVGGTGKVHDWRISQKLVSESKCPIILAGGLNPDNVANAITIVRPYAVDANSQLQASNGFKDESKMTKFILNAKSEFLKLNSLSAGLGV